MRASELPVEVVLNKIDQVDALRRRRLANRFQGAMPVSATTGEGLSELRAPIAERFSARFEQLRMLIPHGEGNCWPSSTSSGPSRSAPIAGWRTGGGAASAW